MARRTGIPTLHVLAQYLCRKLAKFTPLILRLYPDNTALKAALLAAASSCSVLLAELEGVREYGD